MKPCYIHVRKGMEIKHDGPALSIVVPGKSAVLIPLHRISRMVISGSPEFSVSTLLVCAENGITVTFLHHDGTIKAHLFGRSMTKIDLFTCLRDLLDRPDWPKLYGTWLDAATSHARRSLCRKLELQPDRLSLEQICTVLDGHMECFVSASQRGYLHRRLRGLCSNLINAVLQQAGMNPAYSRYINQYLDISGDFSDLLVLSLQLPLIEWLSRRPAQERIDDRDVVAMFERHSYRLERIARRLVGRLYGFLVDLV